MITVPPFHDDPVLLWREAKKAYTQLVFNFPNFEIAETFFNSVFSDIHDHDKISDDIVYVISSQLIEAQRLFTTKRKRQFTRTESFKMDSC